MTVKIIEVNGVPHAYHAHIVYNGQNPNSEDFDPDDNSVVEVIAPLPNKAALATYRSAMPEDIAAGMPQGSQVIDVICPDPMCMSVSTYPAKGDPEARALHVAYEEVFEKKPRMVKAGKPFDLGKKEDRLVLTGPITPIVANAWAREQVGLDTKQGHDHLDTLAEP